MDRVRESFRAQAEACRALGSPFTAQVCELLAEGLDETSAFGRRIAAWPGSPAADALALRAAGALHALARSGCAPDLAAVYPPNAPEPGAFWAALAAAIRVEDAWLTAFLDSPPQTNEVKRCSALLGGCLHVAATAGVPLSLLEIGSSAGLNLGLDQYRYDLGVAVWGDADSPVTVRSDWQGGRLPPLDAAFRITTRRGCDLRPIDSGTEAGRDRLLPYIWADQEDRLATTRAAFEAAARAPWRVEAADAADWIEATLAEPPPPGAARVVMHSIVWQYLPEAVQARVEAAIWEAGARATHGSPLACLRMEPDAEPGSAAVTLTLWPTGEEQILGRADFHGRWVRWTA